MPMKSSVLLVALVGFFGSHAAAADAPRPNIVYFLVDDLGRADVGFNGSKEIRTPHIDRIAKEGAVLDAHYVQPVCSPTRAALLTGRYATQTGVYKVVRPNAGWGMPLEERTLPQALREAGYTTAITGKWHLGAFRPEYMPTKRGFDHQYGHMGGAIDYFTHRRAGEPDWFRNDEPITEPGYATHLIAQEAQRLIRDQPADKPLFLYVAFNGVHSPFQVPEKYRKAYPNLQGVRQTMAGMISAVDEALGQIVGALEEKGLKENTLIVFSSDNGGAQRVSNNAPLRAGKTTIYEGGMRVCAAASWPGRIPAGVRIREPMHIVDWYPTLLKVAGAPLEQKLPLDGRDLGPTLTDGAKTPHDSILLVGNVPGKAAIRSGDWKLLLRGGYQGGPQRRAAGPLLGKAGRGPGGLELYNLAEDIGETKNLAAAQPEKVKELRAKLETFLDDAVPPADGGRGGRPGKRARKKRQRF